MIKLRRLVHRSLLLLALVRFACLFHWRQKALSLPQSLYKKRIKLSDDRCLIFVKTREADLVLISLQLKVMQKRINPIFESK